MERLGEIEWFLRESDREEIMSERWNRADKGGEKNRKAEIQRDSKRRHSEKLGKTESEKERGKKTKKK